MTFRSVHFPGDVSRPWLALQTQARPVALALLAVMTVGLAAALEGNSILWPFVTGAAVAYTLAAGYAQGKLFMTPAQVEVDGAQASVQSVWEAAGAAEARMLPVSSARLQHGELSVGLGDTIVTFEPDEWPEFDELVSAFRQSARLAFAELEVVP